MIAYAAHTRPGHPLTDNQDRLSTDAARGTFIVADGIGGMADGAATAQAVVDQFPGHVHARVTALTGPGVPAAVVSAAAELNGRVRGTARRGPGTTGAATALLLVRGAHALAVHLGDSRIYLARGGGLTRLTDDHAYDGRLTRYIGMSGTAVPGVSVHGLRPGDRLLVCTDGLTGRVDDAGLAALLTAPGAVADVGRHLADAAVAYGSTDDTTLIVVEYTGETPR